MQQFFSAALEYSALFFGSFLVFAAIGWSKRKPKPSLPNFTPNVSCRLIGPGGTYRSHFLRTERRGLAFSSPLQRDQYVPLKVGDSMVVQIPSGDGVVSFRAEIIHRDPMCHEFIVAAPARFRYAERRSEPRDTTVTGRRVEVNGATAELTDISASGARILTPHAVVPGDYVSISFGRGEDPVRGWALDSQPAFLDARPARRIRVRFESPLSGLTLPH